MRIRFVASFLVLVACSAEVAPPARSTVQPRSSSPMAPVPLAIDVHRDVLVTLATLQFAAAVEATEDDRKRDAEHGNFESAMKLDAPLRPEVRGHVESWSPAERQRALAFFRKHPTFSTLYHALAVESFGPPPHFVPRNHGPATVRNAPDLFAARAEFGELLAWAYGAGKASVLASALGPRWAALQLPEAEVEAKKRAVLAYLAYPADEPLPAYNVVHDPLLRELNGYGSNPSDDEILLIVGFTRERGEAEMLLVHEFTHLPLERLLTSKTVMPALERAGCAEAKIGDHKGYDGFANYANETLVRAISYRIAGVQRDTGFLFEPFFAEQLAAYEALPRRDFMAWAPGMLDALVARYCQ